jgi:hypothetical protein
LPNRDPIHARGASAAIAAHAVEGDSEVAISRPRNPSSSRPGITVVARVSAGGDAPLPTAAPKDDVAGLDERRYVLETAILTGFAEIAHRELAGPAHVYDVAMPRKCALL